LPPDARSESSARGDWPPNANRLGAGGLGPRVDPALRGQVSPRGISDELWAGPHRGPVRLLLHSPHEVASPEAILREGPELICG